MRLFAVLLCSCACGSSVPPAPPAVPQIASVSPSHAAPGTTVHVAGANLAAVAHVTLGPREVAFSSAGDGGLDFTVPDAPYTGAVTVATATASASSADAFSVEPQAFVCAGRPSDGGEPGAMFTLSGAHAAFVRGVLVAGESMGFLATDASHLSVTVMAPLRTGPLTIRTDAGTTPCGDHDFVVTYVPQAGWLDPWHAPEGATISLFGQHLSFATDVLFEGGVHAAFTVVNDTELSVTVPDWAMSGRVTVSSPAGVSSSLPSFDADLAVPTLASVTPHAAMSGERLYLEGEHLRFLSAVTIGGVAARFFTDGYTAYADVPAGAASGDIVFTNPVGETSTWPSAFTLLPDEPRLDSFSPTAEEAGRTILADGVHLDLVDALTVGGVAAAFTVDGPTTLHFTVPAGTTGGPVVASHAGVDVIAPGTFTVWPPGPRADFLNPPRAGAGALLDVSGRHLDDLDSVRFGDIEARLGSGSSTISFQVYVPEGAPDGPLVLTSARLGTLASGQAFELLPPLTATPSQGPVGTVVKLTGPYPLSNATKVTLGDFEFEVPFTAGADGSLTAVVPPGAVSARWHVDVAGGGDAGGPFGSEWTTAPFAVTRPPTEDVLVARVSFTNAAPACDAAALANAVFTGARSMIETISAGRTSLSGQVVDVSLPYAATAGCRIPPSWQTDVDAALAAQGVSTARHAILYAAPDCAGNGTTASMAMPGRGFLFLGSCAQDTGAFALAALERADGLSAWTSTHTDLLDGAIARHDAAHLLEAGWLPQAAVRTSADGSQVHLAPLDAASSALQVVHLRTLAHDWYVSYRTHAPALDESLAADVADHVGVYEVDSREGNGYFPMLVRATLAAGQSFSDPIEGIDVSVDAIAADGADVRVNQRAATWLTHIATVDVDPGTISVAPGGSVSFTVTLKNRDEGPDAAASRFNFWTTADSAWNPVLTPDYVLAAPGDTGTVTFTMTAPADAAPGNHYFQIMAEDADPMRVAHPFVQTPSHVVTVTSP